MDINSIDHFNDNDLALSVWKMKYRLNDESTQETLNRIVYNISKKIYYNICKDICDLGMEKIRKLGINRDLMKMYEKASDPNYDVGFPYVHDKIKQYIDYDKILPGGSVIFGIGNMNSYSSLSNCFVIDYPHDSIDGIHQAIGEMKLLEKARGGVGVNVSTIRPKGCEVKNQSKISTGVCLFVEEFSNENNVIAQDGRRGALLICLEATHPDIREFISLKQDLKRVTGANLSVLCNEEFMSKIITGDEYIVQRFPVDTVLDETLYNELIAECEPSEIGVLKKHNYGDNQFYYKVEKVKNIWDDIIHYAWKVAEPGVLFSGNWSLGPDFKYPEYRPISTNPCSEITLPPYDSCRLSSQNLFDIVNNPFTENTHIDFIKLKERSYWNLIITDTIIDLEIEHLENIISKIRSEKSLPKNLSDNSAGLYEKIINITKKGRRCGCGFFAMGDMLAGLNKSYSKESLDIIKNVCETKMLGEVEASVDLASLRDSFEGYNPNLEKYNHIIKNIEHLDKNLFERMLKYGRRNVSWSTVAPTGTISILSGTTSGIEPLFEPFYKRRVKIFEGEADFTDVDGNKFKEFITIHQTFKKWLKVKIGLSDDQIKLLNSEELTKLFQKSPWFGSLANDIDPLDRIDILATVQRYTTHSISSTFNLPENVDKETISQIYLKSYEAGLKGNTVYRENSRAGVLVKTSNTNTVSKRPEILKAKIYKLKYRNHTYGICIGEIDKKPYELFILNGMGVLNESDEEIFEGEIKKVRRGDEWQYDFEGPLNETYDLQLADLNSMEAREEKLISLFISKLLRAAIDIEKICKLIEKSEPIAAKFSYRLNKILMKYYLKDKLLDEKCPNCGSFLTRQDGCVSCKNCGYSKC